VREDLKDSRTCLLVKTGDDGLARQVSALDVEPQQVTPGEGEFADEWHGSDTAMRTVPVVSMHPKRQVGGALT
jgi:hypothetical protein